MRCPTCGGLNETQECRLCAVRLMASREATVKRERKAIYFARRKSVSDEVLREAKIEEYMAARELPIELRGERLRVIDMVFGR